MEEILEVIAESVKGAIPANAMMGAYTYASGVAWNSLKEMWVNNKMKAVRVPKENEIPFVIKPIEDLEFMVTSFKFSKNGETLLLRGYDFGGRTYTVEVKLMESAFPIWLYDWMWFHQ